MCLGKLVLNLVVLTLLVDILINYKCNDPKFKTIVEKKFQR